MIKEAQTYGNSLEDIETRPNAKLSKLKEISKVGLEAYINGLLDKMGIEHGKVEVYPDDWRQGKTRDYANTNRLNYYPNLYFNKNQIEKILLRLKSHIEKNFPSLQVEVVNGGLKFTILTRTKENNWNNGRSAKDNVVKFSHYFGGYGRWGTWSVLLKNGKKYKEVKVRVEDDGRIKIGEDIINIRDVKIIYYPDDREKANYLDDLRTEVSKAKALNKSDSITTEEINYFDY